MTARPIRRFLLASAAGAAVLLGGCQKQQAAETGSNNSAAATQALPPLPQTLPLEAGPATAIASAPAPRALPRAERLPLVRVADPRDAYAYVDRAADFFDALGDAPPDYGFAYDGVEPWAWVGPDEEVVVREPVNDGYWRSYYYAPGSGEPYFISEGDYGYGYDHGALAVVYGPGGTILPPGAYGPYADYAARDYARARALWQARQNRRAVVAANWAAQAAVIGAARSRWAEAEARNRDWQAYRARIEPRAAVHWQDEQARREREARRFAAWRQVGFDRPPPQPIRVVPANYQRQAGLGQRNREQARAAAMEARRQEQMVLSAEQQARASAAQQREAARIQQVQAREQQRAAMVQQQGRQARLRAQHSAVAQRQVEQAQQVQARAQQAQAAQQRQAEHARQAEVHAQQAQARQQAQAAAVARQHATEHARQAEAQAQQARQSEARARQIQAKAGREQAQAARAAQQQARAQAQQSQARAAQAAAREQARVQQAQAHAAEAAAREQAHAQQAQARAAQVAQAHAEAAQHGSQPHGRGNGHGEDKHGPH